MSRHPLLFVLLAALPALAVAREITPASSQIQAVTVFLDRAQVTRQVILDIPAGSHTILVPQLPPRLIEQSLRVRGHSEGRLLIGSVESRRVFGERLSQEKERQLSETLRGLRDDKALVEGRRQALDAQATFIERLAGLPAEQDKNGNRVFAPEKWPAAWQAIGNGMAETNQARAALQRELRGLDDRIKRVEQELSQIRSGRNDSLTAAIHIESAQAAKATLELIYQVPGASWSPVYDAQLMTEQRTLQLTQAAYVRQSTGEDWNNIALTVSTARPSASATMPELSTWWVDFPRPQPLVEMRAKREMSMADEMVAGSMSMPAAAPAEEAVAQAQVSEFAVSHRVKGAVSVAADNSRQRFVLGHQSLTVRLSARAVPRLDPRAYLYAELDYSGETPLLAGQWRLTRDEMFVGELGQEALRPGAKLALAFGGDDAIEIKHHILKDEQGQQGVFNKERRIERRYRIEAVNRHRSALPVSIYDQLPVARNEQIKVTLDSDTTAPTERDPEGRVGVLVWTQELKPQATQTVRFGYTVSYPQGQQVPGF